MKRCLKCSAPDRDSTNYTGALLRLRIPYWTRVVEDSIEDEQFGHKMPDTAPSGSKISPSWPAIPVCDDCGSEWPEAICTLCFNRNIPAGEMQYFRLTDKHVICSDCFMYVQPGICMICAHPSTTTTYDPPLVTGAGTPWLCSVCIDSPGQPDPPQHEALHEVQGQCVDCMKKPDSRHRHSQGRPMDETGSYALRDNTIHSRAASDPEPQAGDGGRAEVIGGAMRRRSAIYDHRLVFPVTSGDPARNMRNDMPPAARGLTMTVQLCLDCARKRAAARKVCVNCRNIRWRSKDAASRIKNTEFATYETDQVVRTSRSVFGGRTTRQEVSVCVECVQDIPEDCCRLCSGKLNRDLSCPGCRNIPPGSMKPYVCARCRKVHLRIEGSPGTGTRRAAQDEEDARLARAAGVADAEEDVPMDISTEIQHTTEAERIAKLAEERGGPSPAPADAWLDEDGKEWVEVGVPQGDEPGKRMRKTIVASQGEDSKDDQATQEYEDENMDRHVDYLSMASPDGTVFICSSCEGELVLGVCPICGYLMGHERKTVCPGCNSEPARYCMAAEGLEDGEGITKGPPRLTYTMIDEEGLKFICSHCYPNIRDSGSPLSIPADVFRAETVQELYQHLRECPNRRIDPDPEPQAGDKVSAVKGSSTSRRAPSRAPGPPLGGVDPRPEGVGAFRCPNCEENDAPGCSFTSAADLEQHLKVEHVLIPQYVEHMRGSSDVDAIRCNF